MANKPKRHQGTAKRVRITGTGKLLHGSPYKNHFLAKKSSGRKRQFAHYHKISSGVSKKVRRLLGG